MLCKERWACDVSIIKILTVMFVVRLLDGVHCSFIVLSNKIEKCVLLSYLAALSTASSLVQSLAKFET